MLPLLRKIRDGLDRFTDLSGRLIAWLVLVLVILVTYDVTNRHLFQSGSIAIQEWEWHLFSLIFLLGAAYTLQHDDHVRLDLLYRSSFMNDYRRAWINLLGSLLMLIPFCVLIIVSSQPFVMLAYTHAESSPDPGGLSHRWLLKAAIPLGFLLLIAQGLSRALDNLLYILDSKRNKP